MVLGAAKMDISHLNIRSMQNIKKTIKKKKFTLCVRRTGCSVDSGSARGSASLLVHSAR